MSQENIAAMEARTEVRGHQVFTRPISRPFQFGSALVDLSIAVFLSAISLEFFGFAPLPGRTFFCFILGVILLYWLPQKKFLGITCGHRIWGVIRKNSGLFQAETLTPLPIFISTLITTVAVLISISSLRNAFVSHPLWITGSTWNLRSSIPEPGKVAVLPFFYTVGGWPTEFAGKPIYYTLPYEKGPPVRFVGKVVATWSAPDIKLTLEGPKTPDNSLTLKEIKNCILKESLSFPCLRARETALMRHIREVSTLGPQQWDLKWFTVDNPALLPEERIQGIYLNATGTNLIQDRFIIVSPAGVHQAIILSRPPTVMGEEAFKLVRQTLGNLRTFPDLNSGRAWVNREIGQVQLNTLNTASDLPTFLSHMTQVQNLLISRISVDPASYESFFHLAGTSLMLVRKAKTSVDLNSRVRSAIQNISSAYRYTQDLNPKDPRAAQIENMWLEAYKN